MWKFRPRASNGQLGSAQRQQVAEQPRPLVQSDPLSLGDEEESVTEDALRAGEAAMQAKQVNNLIVLGEATVSIDDVLIAFGIAGVAVLESSLSRTARLDRAQRIYVVMNRIGGLTPEAAGKAVQDQISKLNTFAVVKAADVSDGALLAWLGAQDRVLVIEQDDSDEGDVVEGATKRQAYFCSSTLSQLIKGLVPEGGQAYLHDFDHEFREIEARDPLALVRLIHGLRSAEIYLMSNASPTTESQKSIYLENPASRFFWAPDISIIMPTYNGTDFIGNTLVSITLQEGVNYEVIVIDDGSSDDTVAFVSDYAMKDDRVLLFRQQNRGPQATRNRGLERSKGKFVTFLDHDDLLLPNSLARRLEVLARKEHLVCGGRCEIVDLEGEPIGLTVGRRFDTYYRDCHLMPVHIGTLTGRSDIMKRHRLPLIVGYADDWTYLNHILREGWSIAACGDEPLIAYRWHRTSWTGSDIDKHFFNCMNLLRDLSIRPAADLGIIEKPEGSMELAEKHIESSRFSRIQAEFYSLALREDEGQGADQLLDQIVGMMNGIPDSTPDTLKDGNFNSTGSKVFIAHPENTAFMKEVMEHWYTAVSLCDRLAITPANARYVDSLTRYLAGLRDRLAARDEVVPSVALMERIFDLTKERFEDVAAAK